VRVKENCGKRQKTELLANFLYCIAGISTAIGSVGTCMPLSLLRYSVNARFFFQFAHAAMQLLPGLTRQI
jgi:hypothetical protein